VFNELGAVMAFLCPHCGQPIERIEDAISIGPVEENPFATPSPTPLVDVGAATSATQSKSSPFALALIAPFAVLMTVVAATYAYKFHSAQFEHPLAVIPDLVGEYRNASQRVAGSHSVTLPKPDQPLPAQLITSLGSPLNIGQIVVTPLRIEHRDWTAYSKRKDQSDPEVIPIKNTLVLTLRLENRSHDVLLYPMDPFFDRRPKDGDRALPYTMIEVDNERFFGGVITYQTDRGLIEREWLDGRELDGRPLAPGESRDVVLVAQPKHADQILAALANPNRLALWRVHLRRGLYEFKGNELSVAAVIGVRFSAADLKAA
jgi:hypothetical protein